MHRNASTFIVLVFLCLCRGSFFCYWTEDLFILLCNNDVLSHCVIFTWLIKNVMITLPQCIWYPVELDEVLTGLVLCEMHEEWRRHSWTDRVFCSSVVWRVLCVLLVCEVQDATDGKCSSVTAVCQWIYSCCTYHWGSHGSDERHCATNHADARWFKGPVTDADHSGLFLKRNVG